jgi:hypothetical protein
MRMLTAWFVRTLRSCTSRIGMPFLPTFQEVMAISKTRNQLSRSRCLACPSHAATVGGHWGRERSGRLAVTPRMAASEEPGLHKGFVGPQERKTRIKSIALV